LSIMFAVVLEVSPFSTAPFIGLFLSPQSNPVCSLPLLPAAVLFLLPFGRLLFTFLIPFGTVFFSTIFDRPPLLSSYPSHLTARPFSPLLSVCASCSFFHSRSLRLALVNAFGPVLDLISQGFLLPFFTSPRGCFFSSKTIFFTEAMVSPFFLMCRMRFYAGRAFPCFATSPRGIRS